MSPPKRRGPAQDQPPSNNTADTAARESLPTADIDADVRLAILVRRPGGGRDSLFLSLEPARQALADAECHGIHTELILVRLVPVVADLSDFEGGAVGS